MCERIWTLPRYVCVQSRYAKDQTFHALGDFVRQFNDELFMRCMPVNGWARELEGYFAVELYKLHSRFQHFVIDVNIALGGGEMFVR